MADLQIRGIPSVDLECLNTAGSVSLERCSEDGAINRVGCLEHWRA